MQKKYKQGNNLLTNISDEFYYLNFAFCKLPMSFSLKPNLIQLPYSIYSQDYNSNICLIVKDPKSDFEDLDIKFPFNINVIDIEDLRIKYERFEQRRELIKQYNIFLCDARIYFALRKYLGKPFYRAKKYPIPVKLNYEKKDEIFNEITKHVNNATFFYMTHGPIYNVKFARAVMKDNEQYDNLICAIKETLPHILKYGVTVDEYFILFNFF